MDSNIFHLKRRALFSAFSFFFFVGAAPRFLGASPCPTGQIETPCDGNTVCLRKCDPALELYTNSQTPCDVQHWPISREAIQINPKINTRQMTLTSLRVSVDYPLPHCGGGAMAIPYSPDKIELILSKRSNATSVEDLGVSPTVKMMGTEVARYTLTPVNRFPASRMEYQIVIGTPVDEPHLDPCQNYVLDVNLKLRNLITGRKREPLVLPSCAEGNREH